MTTPSFDKSLLDKVVEKPDTIDELKEAEKENKIFELGNEKKISKHKSRVFVLTIYFLWGIAISVLLIRIYHFVSPWCWHWLRAEDLQSLDKFLFSGVVGGLLGRYGNKIIE